MKKYLTIIALAVYCLLTVSCVHSQEKDWSKIVAFTNDNYDFGKIPKGVPAEYQVGITNNSDSVIILQNVKAGCGCTTPKFEKDKKIEAGETYNITLGFNAASNGTFLKNAVVTIAGASGKAFTKSLVFRGECIVEKKEKVK